MAFLDAFLGETRNILNKGVLFASRVALDFFDDAFVVTDDAGGGRTKIEIKRASSSADGLMAAADKAKLDRNGSVWRGLVRLVIATNIADLANLPVAQALALVQGDTVLLVAQSTPTQNGPYVLGAVAGGNAPLTRAPWAAASADFTTGMRIAVGPEDPSFAGEDFELTNTGALAVGLTAFAFGVAGTKNPIGGSLARRGNSGELQAVYFDSGAAADTIIKRNGATKVTIGAAAVTFNNAIVAPSLDSGVNVDLPLKRNGSTIVSVSSSGLLFDIGLSTLQVKQTARASDAACSDMTFTTQAPFVTASGANRTGGNLVADFAAPTNGGTLESALIVKRAGTTFLQMGCHAGLYGAIWFGNIVPATSNYGFLGDGSTFTSLSAPSGGTLYMAFGGSSVSGMAMTAAALSLYPNVFNAVNGVTIEGGGTAAIAIDNTGKLAFYTGTPIAQQTRAGQLTDNTAGTPGATLAAVVGTTYSTDIPTIRNWAASLAQRINAVETIIHNIRLST